VTGKCFARVCIMHKTNNSNQSTKSLSETAGHGFDPRMTHHLFLLPMKSHARSEPVWAWYLQLTPKQSSLLASLRGSSRTGNADALTLSRSLTSTQLTCGKARRRSFAECSDAWTQPQLHTNRMQAERLRSELAADFQGLSLPQIPSRGTVRTLLVGT